MGQIIQEQSFETPFCLFLNNLSQIQANKLFWMNFHLEGNG